ncbi:MAG: T9SS type A sorting domain-containing protein [Ignavibacteria bacterium]
MRKLIGLILVVLFFCVINDTQGQTTFWDKTQRVTSGHVDKNPTFDSRKTINHELLFVSFLLFERHTPQGGSNICHLRFGYDSAFSTVGYITSDSNVINRNQKFAFKSTSWVADSITNAMAVWERVENSRVNIYGSTYSNGSWSMPYPIDTGAGNKRSPNISYNTQISSMNFYCVVYEKDGDIIFKNYESTTHQVLNATNLTETDTTICRNPRVNSVGMTQPLFIAYERQKPNGDFAIYYKKSESNYVFTGDTISTLGNNRNADFINGFNDISLAFETNYSGKWGVYEYRESNSNNTTLLQNSVTNYRNLKNYIYPMITNSPMQFYSMLTSYIGQRGNSTKIYSTIVLAPPMDSIIVGDSTSDCVMTMSTGVIRLGSWTGRSWVVYTKDSAGFSMLETAGKLIPLGDVRMTGSEIPESYSLEQNYPNPFNPRTVISFHLPAVSEVIIKIYDVRGREVQTLVNEKLNPGTYETTFDGSNYSSGVYFYQLMTEGFSETNKMFLVK